MSSGCGTPTSFMPAAARTAQGTAIMPAFMGYLKNILETIRNRAIRHLYGIKDMQIC